MAEEILLDNRTEKMVPEEGRKLLGNLEEKIGHLLIKFQELVKEREELVVELDAERERRARLEKKMELLTQDREKVKTRIDELLHRLKGVNL
jgi:chromosome segregation ATPase